VAKGNTRHMFPGGNTSQGFYSYYKYILPQDEAARIFIIKGGPGTGKSTFMKKIASQMLDRGYDVEYMHCSSDSKSIDGVVIPAIKIALVDGTAPHVVEPVYPGAVEDIIYLGKFWNEEGIRKNKDKILKDKQELGGLFDRSYRYLKSAALIYEDTAAIYSSSVNPAKINQAASELIADIFGNSGVAIKEGKQRYLFASAITPDGLKDFIDTIITVNRIYAVAGKHGTGTGKLLERIRRAAVEKGYFTESYYCAFIPEKLEHLIIPQLDVAFTTVNEYHDTTLKIHRKINFNDFLEKSVARNDADALEYNGSCFRELINRAVGTLNRAKAVHARLEGYYIPNMNFNDMQKCRERVMARILDV
jgi:hypothetical protein